MINQPFDQQIDNAESLGLKQLAQMQQTNPDFAQAIAFENLKQSLLAHQNQTDMDNRPMGQPADVIGRNELEVREMLAGMGAPTEPTPMGLPQLSADNMAVRSAAQGGIVGYAPGGGVQEKDRPIPAGQPNAASQDAMAADVANYIKQYNDYEASLANAPTPAEKQQVENKWRVTQKSFPSDTVAAAHQKMSSDSSMAGGGIVSLQGGGGVKSYQPGGAVGPTYPPPPQLDAVTGEYSFFVFDDNGQQIEVDEETYYQVTDLYDQRNRREFPDGGQDTGGIGSALLDFFDSPVMPPTQAQIEEAKQIAAGEESFYRSGSPEAQAIESFSNNPLLSGTGNVLVGEGGLGSELAQIIESDDSWQRKTGKGGVAVAEAGLQSLLKGIGGVYETGKYGFRSGLEGIGGAREQLETKTEEQIEIGRQRLTAEAQQVLDVLEAERAEIMGNVDRANTTEGQQRLDEIERQIIGEGEKLEARLAQLQTPDFGEAVSDIPQSILSFMEQYENDPSSSWVGRTLGGIQDVREEQRIEGLNTAAQAELAANAEAAAPVTPAGWLAEQQRAFDASGARSQRPSMATKEVVGGGEEQEERNWLDKTMDVMELLGGGAGASTGYVGQKILDTAQEKERFESQQAFEQAMQEQLLQQRTDERRMVEDQRLAIAKAAEMAEISVADIIMYPEVTAERERLIDVHDEWFGYDEMAVERDLNAFILRLLNQKRQEIGALYDAAASGNAPSVSGASLPPGVTVIKSSP